MRRRFALGFRVKSGWATSVVLALDGVEPRVLGHGTVLLSDPRAPATRQPYHAGTGREERDGAKIRKRTALVRRAARRSVAELLGRLRAARVRCRRAALVIGSAIDPATIGNPHIRAHASEGQLFRRALEDALRARGIRPTTVRERDLGSWASASLRRSPARLRVLVTRLGAALDGPWRAEEKGATLAAWALLTGRARA